MNKEQREWAKDIFSHYGQEFDATLVFEDDTFFIMDWKDKNGSGNLATRYTVDKKKGDLIIKGDAGCCIASWYGEVTPENMAVYINSTDYFIGKMQCTTHNYTHNWQDVKADFEEIKQKYHKYLMDGDLDDEITEEDFCEDFDEMERLLNEYSPNESVYPSELTDLFEKYCDCWFETGFADLGARINKRIYLWTYGFQEGIERIRGKQFVRKDI